MEELILVDRKDGVATVTLNRPDAMNALSRALRKRFAAVMQALESDSEIDVIILTGAGDRAFSAGFDLKEIALEVDNVKDGTMPGTDENSPLVVAMCTKPVIAAVNGVALTGGLELALACDILIAADHSRFADTHARLGIGPMGGLSQTLPRRIGLARAKQLSLTGNFIDAATALQWGLVNQVVPGDKLLETALALASDMATCDGPAVRLCKQLMDGGIHLSLPEAMEMEQRMVSAFTASRDSSEVAARREGVFARGRAQ